APRRCSLPRIPRPRQGEHCMSVTIGILMSNDIAQAEHIGDSLVKHWTECLHFGTDEKEKKIYFGLIERAKKVRDQDPADPDMSLKQTRLELENLVGDY